MANIVEGEVGFSRGSKVTSEGAEEGITRASGVGDLGEGTGGAAEEVEFRDREGKFSGRLAIGVFGKEDG
ncbi:MAG: hypothetical protein ACK5TA_05720, partial [bacterium]